MKNILIINGPNLNMLGAREPEIYGRDSLEEIRLHTEEKIKSAANLTWFQSNIEGEIVDRLQLASTEKLTGIVINPGAYAHTSIAIYDALRLLTAPVIEVHLSQIYRREEFRHTLLTAKAAFAIMSGLGKRSYYLAIQALID